LSSISSPAVTSTCQSPHLHRHEFDGERRVLGHRAGGGNRVGVFEQARLDARQRAHRDDDRDDAPCVVLARDPLDLPDQRLADRQFMHAG
jgi:hypothetical protein